MKKDKRFCPKCGKQLQNTLIPNETPYVESFMSLTWERVDNAFDAFSGNKLYRVSSDCPTLIGWFNKRPNYGIWSSKGLTEKQAKELYDF